MSSLKFPVAYCVDSKKIEEIKTVKNGKACNCVCLVCSESLIAVNNELNKKEAHFRHNPDSKCNTNVETYLHHIIKELLPDIGKIVLPSIYIEIGHLLNIEHLNNIYTSENLTKTLKEIAVYKKPKEIEFNSSEVQTEKTYKVDQKSIRPDIIIKKGRVTLFLEPFVTNEINQEKLIKIKSLDISCIAINLQLFLKKYGQLFSLNELKDFIKHDINSKAWIWLRNAKRISAVEVVVERLNRRLSDYAESTDKNSDKTNSIFSDIKQIINIEEEIEELKRKKVEIKKRINSDKTEFENKEKELLAKIYDILALF